MTRTIRVDGCTLTMSKGEGAAVINVKPDSGQWDKSVMEAIKRIAARTGATE